MEYDLKTPEQQAELANVVRFAIDRSRLTKEHLDYVIAADEALYEDSENILYQNCLGTQLANASLPCVPGTLP